MKINMKIYYFEFKILWNEDEVSERREENLNNFHIFGVWGILSFQHIFKGCCCCVSIKCDGKISTSTRKDKCGKRIVSSKLTIIIIQYNHFALHLLHSPKSEMSSHSLLWIQLKPWMLLSLHWFNWTIFMSFNLHIFCTISNACLMLIWWTHFHICKRVFINTQNNSQFTSIKRYSRHLSRHHCWCRKKV
jgi:hypothetical protein